MLITAGINTFRLLERRPVAWLDEMEAGVRRRTQQPAVSRPSDGLRLEMLDMERRLAYVRRTQQDARLKFEQKRLKNQGLFWENAQPMSIRRLAEDILQRNERRAAPGLKQQLQPRSFSDRRQLTDRLSRPAAALPPGLLPIVRKSQAARSSSMLKERTGGASEYCDEDRNRREFQEARDAWLRGRSSDHDDDFDLGTVQIQSDPIATEPPKRVCCYHCYKVGLADQSYLDPITGKRFCNDRCLMAYFATNRLACARKLCRKVYESFLQTRPE